MDKFNWQIQGGHVKREPGGADVTVPDVHKLTVGGVPLESDDDMPIVDWLKKNAAPERVVPLHTLPSLHVKFARLHPDAKMPTRATEGSVGLDLYAAHDETLVFGSMVFIDTGIALALPDGWEGQVRGRSGLTRRGVVTAGGIGTCDSDYRGAVGVTLSWPTRPRFRFVDGDDAIKIVAGDRIAQLVIKPAPRVELDEVATVDELGETERGGNGFGSSGK